jgi:hypothetical protein
MLAAMVAVALTFPSVAQAQGEPELLPSPGIALVGGVVSTDFGENDPAGDGTLFGLRLDLPLSAHVVLEPSAERLTLDFAGEDGEDSSVRWQADFAVRAGLPFGRIHPFVGGSLGALLWAGDTRPPESDFVTATYGGLGGVNVYLTERIGVRGEVRLRWLDGLESNSTTLAAGVSWRF